MSRSPLIPPSVPCVPIPSILGGITQHGALRCHKRKLCLGQASGNVTLKARLIDIMLHRTVNSSVQTLLSRVRSFSSTPHQSIYGANRTTPSPTLKTLVTKAAAAAATAGEKTEKEKDTSYYVECRFKARKQDAKIGPRLETQFSASQLYAAISNQSGQVGRAEKDILDGKELEFSVGSCVQEGKRKESSSCAG